MKTVAYTGSSDFQEFSKNDLAKAGLEGDEVKDLRFARGEPVALDDDIADALLSKEGIFGEHSFEEFTDVGSDADTVEELEEQQRQAAQKAADRAARKAAKKAAASTDGTATNSSSTASTGKGTSTGGSAT